MNTDLPVDLTNLRNITGGDPAVELELFEAFFASSGECIEKLRTSLGAGHEQAWRTAAHAFKGISLGLGAQQLGEMCMQAQHRHASALEDKRLMLKGIEEELWRVTCQLKTTQ